jgi:hypothetical protein
VLQEDVKHLNTTVFSGQIWVFQQNSAPAHKAKMTQEWLRGTFRPLSAPGIDPEGVQASTPWTNKLWAVLEDMACRKHHDNLDSLKISPGNGACHNSRVSGASQGLHRAYRAAILSYVIINKNLKSSLINHLVRKADVLFRFPSRSPHTWDRTYGRTVICSWSSVHLT